MHYVFHDHGAFLLHPPDTRVPEEAWGSVILTPNASAPLLESEAQIFVEVNGSAGGPQARIHYYIHEHYVDGVRAGRVRGLRVDDPVYTGEPIQLPVGHVTLNVDIYDPDRQPGFLPRIVTPTDSHKWRGLTSASYIVLPAGGMSLTLL